MTTSLATQLLRKPGQPERAAFLELFFDLVFIFALTRVSQRLVQDITTDRRFVLTEAGETLLALLAVWMVWSITVLITDLYDPDEPRIQLLVVATMFGSMVMALAVPEAFGRLALPFAGAYVAIHLGRGLFLVPALRGHAAQHRAARVLFWFAVSAVPWIIGALAPGGVIRGSLWTVAIALDYAALLLRLPVPRLGRSPEAELSVAAEHVSERFRQLFIIGLGELILITGAAFSGSDLSPGKAAAFWVSFVTTVLMWRIYIYRAGELLPSAIVAARFPGRLALWISTAHLVMVVGIVAIAAGFEVTITHPFGHTDPDWVAVILGGPAMFLIGRAGFEYALFNRVSLSRPVGAVLLGALAPATVHTPPMAVAAAATGVLLAVAVTDAIRRRPIPTPH